MKYKVINLLSGAVTIVIAKGLIDAIRKGQNHFTEPNGNKVQVQVLN